LGSSRNAGASSNSDQFRFLVINQSEQMSVAAEKKGSHVAEKTRYVYSALTLPSLQKLDRDAV